jgi:hypothetical protein
MRCAELDAPSSAALLWSLAPFVYSWYTRERSWYGVLFLRLVVCCCAMPCPKDILRHLAVVATAILALLLPFTFEFLTGRLVKNLPVPLLSCLHVLDLLGLATESAATGKILE